MNHSFAASVRRLLAIGAGLLACSLLAWSQSAQGPRPDVDSRSATPTPRTADGHPDLAGYWGGGGAGLGGFPAQGGNPGGADAGIVAVVPLLRNGDISNLTNDGLVERESTDDLPLYKPQYWTQILDNERHGETLDPFSHCLPITPPRIGPPARIVVLPHEMIFFYRVGFQPNTFRDIPIGSLAYPPDPDGTWMGDPAGHWDGDTLVVETIGYNDSSWLDRPGFIHGYNLKTVERFRRDGSVLHYDVTVEDPEYLQKPWVVPTQTVNLNGSPHAWLQESPPCDDHDLQHIVGPNQE